jgi:ankyrin repeat protein
LQIFYAAAYGRVEALSYLLRTLPDAGLGVQFGLQWIRGDVHGDTPLHAAAASGCAQCVELLLQALTRFSSIAVDLGVTSIANVPNNMNMTPTHLASSADCLDVLYRYPLRCYGLREGVVLPLRLNYSSVDTHSYGQTSSLF